LQKAVVDFGATFHAAMVQIGDKLGLYKALAAEGPLTAAELAQRTSTAERYVRERLASQAAGGYVTYDTKSARYSLSEEQAFTLADDNSPAFLPGAFQVALAAVKAEPRVLEAFRTGGGVGWHEHDPELFLGTERFFRPGYAAHLTTEWIPALDGVEAKLRKGARVADVGCGHGASTILMGQAYPKSNFIGFDYHGPSIEAARKRPRLLFCFDADLHACFPGPGGWPCARRAGRRGAHAPGGHVGRLHALPARRADALQHHLRSSAIVKAQRPAAPQQGLPQAGSGP
jgi:2-polyprenyl-3-methyl-5-hydroxy-6-metoxy-1,4-benzoquinol methylase